jgi:hypothetical protein
VVSERYADRFFGSVHILLFGPAVLDVADEFLAITPIPNWTWLGFRQVRVGPDDISVVRFRAGVFATGVSFITLGGQRMEPEFRPLISGARVADALQARGWPTAEAPR